MNDKKMLESKKDMPDEQFLLPDTPKREVIDNRPHPIRLRLDVCALFLALLAALFSFLQWRASVRQAEIADRAANQQADLTKRALENADKASKEQAQDVERSRTAAEESASAARKLADTALNQYRLNFAPSVEIIYADKKLNVYNRGRENIWLWGTKVQGFPLDLGREGRLIVPGGFYYILGDRLEAVFADMHKDQNNVRIPCEIFIETADGQKYATKISLWAVFSNGDTQVHCQTLDIQRLRDWPAR